MASDKKKPPTKGCLRDNVYEILASYERPGKYNPQNKNEIGELRLWGLVQIQGEDVSMTNFGKELYKTERYERSSLTTKLLMKLRLKK